MRRRERSESFYIPSEKIEKYKKEFTPVNRKITTIEEGNEDEDSEIEIKRDEVDPEIAMLAHMVDKELISRRDHNARNNSAAEIMPKEFQAVFADFDDMNLQVDQINGTRSEDIVIRANIEFAGESCSSFPSVIDSK